MDNLRLRLLMPLQLRGPDLNVSRQLMSINGLSHSLQMLLDRVEFREVTLTCAGNS